MGKEKGGFLTPKAIANRIKSKGLQKLRWFCQMCHKQCRDENGFQCHLTSESHQRQLLLFAENPNQYIDTFSQEFLDTFTELMSRRFGTKRVRANQVYQEYISDREHTHMNSTQWETLTDFVKWLGREGHCIVDETEKGWFVQYIDKNPDTIKRQESMQKKEKMDLDDEEKIALFVEKQIERASAGQTSKKPDIEYTELQRESEEEKVAFSFGSKKVDTPSTSHLAPVSNPLKAGDSNGLTLPKSVSESGTKRKSALAEIIEVEKSKKQKKEQEEKQDNWLHEGIYVKVITKKLGEKFYKKKGVVKEVQNKYLAVVKMVDSGTKLKLDQQHLETVIPAIGKPVLVLNGRHRGAAAFLEQLDEKKFACTARLCEGKLQGTLSLPYEYISKMCTE